MDLNLSIYLRVFSFMLTIGPTFAQLNTIIVVSTATLPPLTAKTIVVDAPTPVSAAFDYDLLGCYNELGPEAGGRAVGLSGQYISPAQVVPEAMTVPLCLEYCHEALAPDGSGHYKYAALENSRECYCGQTLSNSSTVRDPAYCSYPCSGNVTTTCGGYGYLDLYQLKSTITNTSQNSSETTSSTSNSTPTNTSTSSPQDPGKTAGMWVGVAFGILIFLTLIGFLLICLKNRHKKAQPPGPPPYTQKDDSVSPKSSKFSLFPFIGAFGGRKSKIKGRDNTSNGNENGYTGNEDVDWNSGVGEENTLQTTLARPDQEWPLSPELGASEKGVRVRRETLEGWKTGVVPQLLGDTLSDGIPELESQGPEMQSSRRGGFGRATSAGSSVVSPLVMSYLGERDNFSQKAELSGGENENTMSSVGGTNNTVSHKRVELESPLGDTKEGDTNKSG